MKQKERKTMKNGTIKETGTKAEQVLTALTGYTETDVEMKGINFHGPSKSKTLNQIRPVECKPLVALHWPDEQWYVIPPLEVIRLAWKNNGQIRRGQHSKANPFNCVGMSMSKKMRETFACDKSDVKTKIDAAIKSIDASTKSKLISLMTEYDRANDERRTDIETEIYGRWLE